MNSQLLLHLVTDSTATISSLILLKLQSATQCFISIFMLRNIQSFLCLHVWFVWVYVYLFIFIYFYKWSYCHIQFTICREEALSFKCFTRLKTFRLTHVPFHPETARLLGGKRWKHQQCATLTHTTTPYTSSWPIVGKLFHVVPLK